MTDRTAGPPPLAMGYSPRVDRDGPTMTDDPRDHIAAAWANDVAALCSDLCDGPGSWIDGRGERVVYPQVAQRTTDAHNRAIMLTERAGVDLSTLELMCAMSTTVHHPYVAIAQYHRARARLLSIGED